jgi:hypothetical protein
MDTLTFTTWANDSCKTSRLTPDQDSVRKVLEMAHPKHRKGNLIVIARWRWLRYNGLQLPDDAQHPNLCLTISNGQLIRAFYSSTLTHIIKKQSYFIQVLN